MWRIYYADGSTFAHTDGAPQDTPTVGVVAIAEIYAGERKLMASWDWYYYVNDATGGAWWGSDIHGALRQMATNRRVIPATLREGQTIHTSEWRTIMSRAHTDPIMVGD